MIVVRRFLARAWSHCAHVTVSSAADLPAPFGRTNTPPDAVDHERRDVFAVAHEIAQL